MQQIIGQQRALSVLRAQVASGRVHHAQVFHGPPGVGKFTTAAAFAELLLCHDPVTDLHGHTSACGACASCNLLGNIHALADRDVGDTDDPAAALASPHPDLHLVTKELALFDDDAQVRNRKLTTIPISVIRSHLIGPANLASRLGHGKVFIIDEAELLAGVSQNAILKTLEEPSAATYLILVTSRESDLLPTIRSRCQRVPFVPLADEEVGRWLDRHAHGAAPPADDTAEEAPDAGMFGDAGGGSATGGATGGGLDEKTRQWVVGFAQGSIGRASLAVEYGLVEWGQAVLSPMMRMARGGRPEAGLGAAIAERVDAFAKGWVASHKNASKEAANRRAAALMGSMIANFARRRMAEQAAECDPEQPGASEEALAPWLGVIRAVEDAERQLASNVNLTLVCAGLGASITTALMEKTAEPGAVA